MTDPTGDASCHVRGAAGLLGRTDVGLYATYAGDRDFVAPHVNLSALSLGVVADVRPLPAPLLGRVEPFVSVGAGMLRTDVSYPLATAPSPLLERSRSAFTVTPGIGTRVRITPWLSLQGDVRDFVTFRGDTRHNVAYALGLHMGL